MQKAPLTRPSTQSLTPSEKLGFLDGGRALFRGVRWVIGTPSVWPLAMVPAALALILVVGFTAGGYFLGDKFLLSMLPGAATSGESAVGVIVSVVVGVLVFVISAIVGLLVGLSLAQPLSAPALDALAKKRARELGVTHFVESPALPSMARSLRVVGLALVVGLPLILLLSLVTLLFPPASIVTFPLKFAVAAWLAAWDIFDYPFAFGALGVRARIAWLRQNAGAAFAFGLGFAAVALVPGLGLFAIPMGVAGATDLWVRSQPVPDLPGDRRNR